MGFGMIPPPQPAAAPAPPAKTSRVGMPGKDTLDYLKVGIEVLLLLLAIPWILRELIRHPGTASRRAANKHLGAS